MENQITFSFTDKLKAFLFVATTSIMLLFCIIKFAENPLKYISPMADSIIKESIILDGTAFAPIRQCFVNEISSKKLEEN